MAVTDYDYLETRNEIIRGAFRIVGALATGQTLSGDKLDQGVRALQLLVKSWTNKHLFLWAYDLTNFDTIADQEVYDETILDPNMIGIDKGWIVDSGEDIPLEVISYSRYLDIYDKETNSGRPFAIAYKPTPSPSVYLWPSPDAIYTVKTLGVFPLKDLEEAGESGDIPIRFQRALKYGLAEDLFDEYPGPMNEREYVQNKAAYLFKEAANSDFPSETTNEVEGLF